MRVVLGKGRGRRAAPPSAGHQSHAQEGGA
jgi:hypothetical protein